MAVTMKSLVNEDREMSFRAIWFFMKLGLMVYDPSHHVIRWRWERA